MLFPSGVTLLEDVLVVWARRCRGIPWWLRVLLRCEVSPAGGS